MLMVHFRLYLQFSFSFPVLWSQLVSYRRVLKEKKLYHLFTVYWKTKLKVLESWTSSPSFYSFLTELQNEQADIEYKLREISLG